ncbi:hypothetical protein MIR68_000019 [Amoeboaphelidium protococcarum]|nr:hypothetical protein MIR68_000019 [Amoeboaphelidium protococcarum]
MQVGSSSGSGNNNNNIFGGNLSGGMLVVKAYCQSEIRRIPIFNRDLTYAELCIMLSRLFKHHLNKGESSNYDNTIADGASNSNKDQLKTIEKLPELVLKYKDDEGDWIELTDDMDVQHAIQLSNVFHVKVQIKREDGTNNDDDFIDWAEMKETINQLKDQVGQLVKVFSAVSQTAVALSTKPSAPSIKPLSTRDMADFLGQNDTVDSSMSQDTVQLNQQQQQQSLKDSMQKEVQVSEVKRNSLTSTAAALGDLRVNTAATSVTGGAGQDDQSRRGVVASQSQIQSPQSHYGGTIPPSQQYPVHPSDYGHQQQQYQSFQQSQVPQQAGPGNQMRYQQQQYNTGYPSQVPHQGLQNDYQNIAQTPQQSLQQQNQPQILHQQQQQYQRQNSVSRQQSIDLPGIQIQSLPPSLQRQHQQLQQQSQHQHHGYQNQQK